MIEHIGVLGCGWLGFPLAKRLIQKGYGVSGTTTSKEKLEELQSNGIEPFHIVLSEDGIHGDINDFLSKVETLVVNVPPALRSNPKSNYVKKMELLRDAIEKHDVRHLLFISSTSVYGDRDGEITEKTSPKPISESGKQLMASENLFFDQKSALTSIVRFGGLIGPDRHPVYHLSSRENLENGNELINLIHLEDCIHMITTIIENEYWNEVFNGVYPYHPKKCNFYKEEAEKRQIPIPKYNTSDTKTRKKTIISKNFLNKGHVLYTSIAS